MHTRHIADEIIKRGAQVRVVTYGGALPSGTILLPYPVTRISLALPAPLRWFLYTLVVMRYAFWADVVYAFDPSAAGIPAACAASFTTRKFFIRIGGDLIWERVAEKKERFLPLNEYYKRNYHRADRPFLYHLIHFVLSRADSVIVPTQILADLYARYFAVPVKRIHLIPNPIPQIPREVRTLPYHPLTLYAGRFVAYKNLPFVLRVFARIHKIHPESRLLLRGNGPKYQRVMDAAATLGLGDAIQILPAVAHEKLEHLQKQASIALAPALTEFNPNFALEALAYGTPVLVSRENGLTVRLPEECLFDSTNEDEMFERWNALLDPSVYARVAAESARAIPNHMWTDVTTAHARLLGI